jgi:hypothetical protein
MTSLRPAPHKLLGIEDNSSMSNAMPKSFRRIDKLSHSDTILYEIYTQRFAAGTLPREDFKTMLG